MEETKAKPVTEMTAVQVRFVSRQNEGLVPATPFSVPLTLNRYGLSELVNHLVNQDPPRPYDFLINGEFLRTDLATFLQKKAQSEEGTLVLEYVEAMPQPEELPSRPHPDWVSAVDGSDSQYILTACYDGIVRVFSNSNLEKSISSGTAHKNAVKGVKWFLPSLAQKDNKFFVSASKDKSLRVWKAQHGSPTCDEVSVAEGHTDSVECVDVIAAETTLSGYRFASGSWDKSIALWQLPPELVGSTVPSSSSAPGHSAMEDEEDKKSGDAVDAEQSTPGRSLKKRKLGTGASRTVKTAATIITPLVRLEGHTQCVSSIAWPHPLALYSGSWDHSIRLWDPNTAQHTNTWYGTKVISSLSFSGLSNLLATAHDDKAVRIWDPRLAGKEIIKMTLKSHKAWVSGVSWSRGVSHHLASTGHDGSVKLWDIRSTVPLFTLKGHEDKGLCVDWHAGNEILSGGADFKLHRHRVQAQPADKAT